MAAGLAAATTARLHLASIVVALVRLELFGLVRPIRQESTKVSEPMATMLTRPYSIVVGVAAALRASMAIAKSRSAS